MQQSLTPTAGASQPAAAARLRPLAIAGLLCALALVLTLINLDTAPAPWFDEGSHLHVPKTLIDHGVYADISSEGFRYYGPTIGVGPTVLLPIAAAFKLAGPSFLAGRLVIAGYLLAGLAIAALLARRLHGPAAAAISLALLLGSRTFGHDGMLEYGRQVLGEVPGVTFLLLGCLLWYAAVTGRETTGRPAIGKLIGSGLCFGLAMVTKNQFALVVGPGLALISLLDLVYYRRGGWALRLLPPAVSAACFGAWMLITLTWLGPGAFAENLALTRRAAGGAIFVFDPASSLRALRYIIQPYGGLLLPALAYALWRCRARTTAALAELPVALLPVLWLGWYLCSLGWPRYAFPAVALGALALARLLRDAWERLGPRPRIALAAYATCAVAVPLALSLGVVLRPDDSAQRVAEYLQNTLPAETVIETWEPELGVLSDHRFHYPPNELLDPIVRGYWLNGPTVSYPLPADPPEYLIVGPFGHYSGVYGLWVAADTPYEFQLDIGPYALFKLRP